MFKMVYKIWVAKKDGYILQQQSESGTQNYMVMVERTDHKDAPYICPNKNQLDN